MNISTRLRRIQLSSEATTKWPSLPSERGAHVWKKLLLNHFEGSVALPSGKSYFQIKLEGSDAPVEDGSHEE